MSGALRYTDDSRPGITRKRRGRYWQYFGPSGRRITSRKEIDRLNAIGMPPAYREVWLSPDPKGHIQGIGVDDRGRRQYRYHPDFRARRDRGKFARLAAFGAALPKLRRRIAADLKGKPTSCDAVIAAVIRLIDATYMRVGNEEYAKENKSFGATTLRNRHASVKGETLRIAYAGKHGIKRIVTVSDPALARIARRTQDLPGQNLFEFLDASGCARPVGSADVNGYIREATGEEFTAKDFRTWAASVIAFEALIAEAPGVNNMIEPVAEALGNTVAIARKSYVHPKLIDAAKAGGLPRRVALPRASRYLSSGERGLIAFLGRRK